MLDQTSILTVKETQLNKSFSAGMLVKRLLFSLRDSKEALTVTVSFRWLRRRHALLENKHPGEEGCHAL